MDDYAYLDSSVVLRRLLGQSGAMPALRQWRLFSSQLLDVEVRRTLLHYHAQHSFSGASLARRVQEWKQLRDSMDLIPISDGIIKRAAEPFPTLLKALDAIHLATALLWTAQTHHPATMLTHDTHLAIASSACGFPVGP